MAAIITLRPQPPFMDLGAKIKPGPVYVVVKTEWEEKINRNGKEKVVRHRGMTLPVREGSAPVGALVCGTHFFDDQAQLDTWISRGCLKKCGEHDGSILFIDAWYQEELTKKWVREHPDQVLEADRPEPAGPVEAPHGAPLDGAEVYAVAKGARVTALVLNEVLQEYARFVPGVLARDPARAAAMVAELVKSKTIRRLGVVGPDGKVDEKAAEPESAPKGKK